MILLGGTIMIKKTNIDLSISPKRKNPLTVGVQLSSYDKNFHEFEISFLEKELKEGDTVTILTVFESSKRDSKSTTEIKGGYALFSFDTTLIDREEVVTNYVYLKSGDSQAEIGAFRFDVKLSEIDNEARVIAKAYDEGYESLIHDFEKELRDYLGVVGEIQEDLNKRSTEVQKAKQDARESANIAQQAMADYLAMLGVDIATLGADGKLTADQIPALAINDTFTVNSKEEITELVAQRGDVAILIHDENVSDAFILMEDAPEVLDNWIKLGVSYVAEAGHAETATNAVNAQRINGHRLVTLSQEQYDLGAKDPDTVYLVGDY